MCRRELDKAESEIKKNSSIIGDYKQVGLCTLELGCAPSSPAGLREMCPHLTQELLVLSSRMRGMAAFLGHVGGAPGMCVPCRYSVRPHHVPGDVQVCVPASWSCVVTRCSPFSPWLFAFKDITELVLPLPTLGSHPGTRVCECLETGAHCVRGC